LRGRNMVTKATGGIHTIVTTNARLSCHGVMIESDRPIQGGVAGIARLCGSDMGGVFAGGNNAVVTTFTSSCDVVVIHPRHAPPITHNMASLATVGTGDVQGRFAGCCSIVMATVACPRDMVVIHSYNRVPNTGRMACVTGI